MVFFSLQSGCVCVYFFVVMVRERNVHNNQTMMFLFFTMQKGLVRLLRVNRNSQNNMAHWEMMKDIGS